MKNPFILLREISLENFEKTKNNVQIIFQNIEKFILWIVGFSVGAIGIIISNFETFLKYFNHCELKKSLILFVASLIFGIFNRYSIIMFQTYFQHIENFIRLSLTNYDFPELEPENIENESDIITLINYFKNDYDLDYSHFYNNYIIADAIEQKNIISKLKKDHNELGKIYNKLYFDGLENVRGIYKQAFDLSEEKSKKLFYQPHSKVAMKFNIWKYLVDFFFIFSCLFFVLGVINLIISF